MTPDTAHHAQSRQSVFTPSLNWLFALIPVSVALERAHAPDPVLFFSAALAIGPIARLIVLATEQLAVRTGDAIGRLLNATFGNAPELIIALVALKAGLFDMVRASIIGAILANLMLATGLAFLLGGLRYHTPGIQRRRGAARLYSSMMLISAVSLGVPSAFNRFFSPDGTLREEKLVNLGTAFVLLAAYALYLVFLLKTHPDYFQSAAMPEAEHDRNSRPGRPSRDGVATRHPVGGRFRLPGLFGRRASSSRLRRRLGSIYRGSSAAGVDLERKVAHSRSESRVQAGALM